MGWRKKGERGSHAGDSLLVWPRTEFSRGVPATIFSFLLSFFLFFPRGVPPMMSQQTTRKRIKTAEETSNSPQRAFRIMYVLPYKYSCCLWLEISSIKREFIILSFTPPTLRIEELPWGKKKIPHPETEVPCSRCLSYLIRWGFYQ